MTPISIKEIREMDAQELTRNALRQIKVLTFDCFNAVTDGKKVRCKCGRTLGPRGAIGLDRVLKGVSSPNCRDCDLYED
jgi:hypothetical protein